MVESDYPENIISAECSIGMVWGLTALKHYGNKALWHYGTNV